MKPYTVRLYYQMAAEFHIDAPSKEDAIDAAQIEFSSEREPVTQFDHHEYVGNSDGLTVVFDEDGNEV